MSVIFLLLPIALVLAGAALWAFVRAVRRGEFDDLETPAYRAVFDDDEDVPGRPPERPAAAPE